MTNYRYFYRIRNFKRDFESFRNYENTDLQTLTGFRRQKALNSIKHLFELYYKSLRDLLKSESVVYYPREVLSIAQEKGIITDSKIWIHYIDLLNVVCWEKNTEKNQEAVKEILTVYPKHLYTVSDNLEKIYQDLINKNPKLAEKKEYNISMFASTIKPEYICSELGLDASFYELFIDYVKTDERIKTLWIHGSRAEKKHRKNSDIDLLIDCKNSDFSDIVKKLNRIRIPHRIDGVCINDEKHYNFLAETKDSAKIIYRREDFSY